MFRQCILLTLAAFAVALGMGDSAFGQFRGGPPGRGGGDGGGNDWRLRILQRMDENGNGSLEPDEVPSRARGFIQRMAQGAGLDAGRPIPINRIAESGGRDGSSRFRGRRDEGDRGRGDDRRRRSDEDRSSSSSRDEEFPLVPRFGEENFAGFGVNPLTLEGQIVDLEKRYDDRVLENVQRVLGRYDRNGNGVLERHEWAGIRWQGDPRDSDLDNDGQLTKAEMAERLANRYGQQDDRADASRSRRSSSGSDRSSRRGEFRPRSFDPTPMLQRFDRNGDGVVAPDELDDRTRTFAARILQRVGVDLDGPIRIDEVRRRIQSGDATGGQGGESDGASDGSAYRIVGSERFKGRRSYRHIMAPLPNTLPDWWYERDENQDGQVDMAEFLVSGSDQEIDRFRDYDLNEDGVVTLREAEFVEQNPY